VARLVSGDVAAYRVGSHHYLATGTDDAGEWAMAWTLEPQFRGWQEGAPSLAEARPELHALTARLPENGSPVLFRKREGRWQTEERL
jgi:hypothetical protein